jgi:hypothetical protein
MAWNGQVQRARVPRHDVAPIAALQRQLLPPQGLPALDTLPGFSRARLPAAYQAAHKAISKCWRIDECKSWSDKAAALASYARQAKDHTLCMMAKRIQARAIRRCGELLKQVPSGQGSRNQHGELRNGAVTRREAASEAGLSDRQRVTALRIASMPAPKFESVVEGEPPPTVTHLAHMGAQPSAPSPSVRRPRIVKAREVFGTIREFCKQNAPADLAAEFESNDQTSLREFAANLQRWLEEFVAHLPQHR